MAKKLKVSHDSLANGISAQIQARIPRVFLELVRDVQDIVLSHSSSWTGAKLIEKVRPLQQELLEVLLGFLNDFSLVQVVNVRDLILRELLKTLPAQEEDFELVKAFAWSDATHLLQHFLEVLS